MRVQPMRAPIAVRKRQMGIRELLEWAFQRELASLDFDGIVALGGTPLPAWGMEYVLIERAKLGCRIDGGGRSDPHPDAEVVAAALAALPARLGGRSMAIRVTELARAGMTPDWMEGALTRCVPREWKENQNGRHAATELVGRVEYVDRGRRRSREVRCCPVTFHPTVAQIAAARRAYLDWWRVLWELREHFRIGDGLCSIEVTGVMPKRVPWT